MRGRGSRITAPSSAGAENEHGGSRAVKRRFEYAANSTAGFVELGAPNRTSAIRAAHDREMDSYAAAASPCKQIGVHYNVSENRGQSAFP